MRMQGLHRLRPPLSGYCTSSADELEGACRDRDWPGPESTWPIYPFLEIPYLVVGIP
jgi:hypothetical protein